MSFLKYSISKSNSIVIEFDSAKWLTADPQVYISTFKTLRSAFTSSKEDDLLQKVAEQICRRQATSYLEGLKRFQGKSERCKEEGISLLCQSIRECLIAFFSKTEGRKLPKLNVHLQEDVASTLAEIGKFGKKHSRKVLNIPSSIEENPKHQWKLFFWCKSEEYVFHFCGMLALCLWRDRISDVWIKNCLEIDREEKNHPAVVETVYQVMTNSLWTQGNKIIETNEGLKLVDRSENILAGIEPQNLESIVSVDSRLGKLGTIHGQKLVRFVFSEIQKRHFSRADDPRNSGDPWTLVIEGGLRFLTFEILGFSKATHIKDIREAINAGRMLNLRVGNKYIGGLWNFLYEEKRGRGAKSTLALSLGFAFRPHFNAKERPILTPVTKIPPLVGRSNEHGKQAAFQWALVGELVKQRMLVAKEGGANIDTESLSNIGAKCGLSASLSQKAWDRWLSDGDDGLKVFEIVETSDDGKNLFHLADNEDYREPRAFINETASRSFKNSTRAKRHWDRQKRKEQ